MHQYPIATTSVLAKGQCTNTEFSKFQHYCSLAKIHPSFGNIRLVKVRKGVSHLNATKLNTARGSGGKAAAPAAKEEVVVGDHPRATANCMALLNTFELQSLVNWVFGSPISTTTRKKFGVYCTDWLCWASYHQIWPNALFFDCFSIVEHWQSWVTIEGMWNHNRGAGFQPVIVSS